MADHTTLDVLALAAHPDDVELCAGGTMCLLARQGYRTGIVDYTRGELGTKGSPELRMEEARAASEVMGLTARENLGMPDGRIEDNEENQRKVIRVIRRYRPKIVLINPLECRHPDHTAAAKLSISAMFFSGLVKIETFEDDGAPQAPWRPHHVLHYMQSVPFTPTFVVDVTEVWEDRMRAMMAYRSQFHNPDESGGEQTFISNPDFLQWIESQARWFGYRTGATYGEPLLYRNGPFGVSDLVAALGKEKRYR